MVIFGFYTTSLTGGSVYLKGHAVKNAFSFLTVRRTRAS
tara:strand:- start:7024 stop:7140 length:117 start_codon:yes stop_codon:yes gene_type:complete